MINIKDKIKSEGRAIKREIQRKVSDYVLAAFSLVAALAWNDAIKSFIEYVFPLNQNTILIKFFYAITITLIVVIISVYLTRLLAEKNGENK